MVNDQLLEDVLNQLKRNNGLQQALVDSIRRDVQGSRRSSGGGGDTSSSNTRTTKSLNQLSSAASSLSSGMMNARNASDAAGVMFKGIGAASKVLPVFGGAIGLAATAAQQFYEFLNGNLQTFNQLNEAGLSASGGMFGLQKALATGRVSMDEFMSATVNYRDVIAGMGADGVQKFGNLMNSVIQTEDSMGALNMSNQTLASTMGGYLKQQRAYSAFEKMDRQINAKAARDYADNLQNYSKSLGMTIEELSGKMAQASESSTGLGTQLALMEQGMSEEDAAKSAENLSMVMGSFGKFGDAMQEQLATFINTGGDLNLDSTIGQLYQVDNQFRDMFNGIADMAKSGKLTSKEAAEMIRKQMSSKETVEAWQNSMGQFRKSFGDAAANQAFAMLSQVKNYEAETQKPTAAWDKMVNDFNRDMEAVMQKFKIGTAELFLNPQQFIIDMFGEKWGKWLLTGAFDWSVDSIPMLPSVKEWLASYMQPVKWLYDYWIDTRFNRYC